MSSMYSKINQRKYRNSFGFSVSSRTFFFAKGDKSKLGHGGWTVLISFNLWSWSPIFSWLFIKFDPACTYWSFAMWISAWHDQVWCVLLWYWLYLLVNREILYGREGGFGYLYFCLLFKTYRREAHTIWIRITMSYTLI
jgi:hypothetical protein